MGATTPRSPERAGHGPGGEHGEREQPGRVGRLGRVERAGRTGRPERVARFSRTERAVHWVTAVLVLTLVVTGAVLYVPSLSVLVGHRLIVENTHIFVGVSVFIPLLVALAGRWGAQLRADLHEMKGLTPSELAWLRSLGRRGRDAIGKFNPGQKLNTNAIGGLLVVLFVTGLILRWGNFLPVSVRTGATFVHDVFAVALFAVVCGHIAFAVTHPHALRSMVTGWVPSKWLRRHAPAWAVRAASPSARTGPTPQGPVPPTIPS
ncbi:MAG TPA: cytochrome b/b6 domain-containing protein [Acidimicrobiales bacterium]|nr:cytochrome b/b6 domain-containing protein [Acidimicrobiales bacterium]